tara:strand:- start:102219 stop:102452 length:234 start_codon:yes stop_codon:yes gene_type:complete
MAKRVFRFQEEDPKENEAMAHAFAEGVEWVNDSAVEVRSIERNGDAWDVIINDDDATEDTLETYIKSLTMHQIRQNC